MSGQPDHSLRQLQRDVASRQYYPRGPQPIAETISRLLSRKGYAQVEGARQRVEAWRQVAGPQLAGDSCPGTLRRGVLEVVVRNSAVLQELTFQKKTLVRQLAAALPELKIRDIRFRVGSLD